MQESSSVWPCSALSLHRKSVSSLLVWGPGIVSADEAGSLVQWSYDSKSDLKLPPSADGLGFILLQGPGSRLYSLSKDGTLRIWTTGASSPERTVHLSLINCLAALLVDGKLLCAVEREVRIFVEAQNFSKLRSMTGHQGAVTSLVYWNSKVISGSSDATLRVWNLENGSLEKTLTSHTDAISALLAWDRVLVSGSWDKSVKLWNLDGKCERSLIGHRQRVTCLSPCGPSNSQYFASGSSDGTVRLWTATGNCLKVLEAPTNSSDPSVSSMVWAPLALALYVGSADGLITKWVVSDKAVHDSAVSHVIRRIDPPSKAIPIPPQSASASSSTLPQSLSDSDLQRQKTSPPPAQTQALSSTAPSSAIVSPKPGSPLVTKDKASSSLNGSGIVPAKTDKAPAVTKKDSHFATLLEHVRKGNEKGVKELVKEHNDILVQTDDSQQSAMHVAAAEGKLSILKLVFNRSMLNLSDKHGWTPLLCAAHQHHFDVCKYLLENGAHANSLTSSGTSALHLLARYVGKERKPLMAVLELLVDKGGCEVNKLNVNQNAPLHEAVEWGNLDVVNFLIARGARVDVVNKLGETPTKLACRKNRNELVTLLTNVEQQQTLPQNKLQQRQSRAGGLSPSTSSSSMAAVVASSSPASSPRSGTVWTKPTTATASSAASSAQSFALGSVSVKGDADRKPLIYDAAGVPYVPMPSLTSPAQSPAHQVASANGSNKPAVPHRVTSLRSDASISKFRIRSEMTFAGSLLRDGTTALPAKLDLMNRRVVVLVRNAQVLSAALAAATDASAASSSTSSAVASTSPSGPLNSNGPLGSHGLLKGDGKFLRANHRARGTTAPSEYTPEFSCQLHQLGWAAADNLVELWDGENLGSGGSAAVQQQQAILQRVKFQPLDAERHAELLRVLHERLARVKETPTHTAIAVLHNNYLLRLRQLATQLAAITAPKELLSIANSLVTAFEELDRLIDDIDFDNVIRILEQKFWQSDRLVELFCGFYTQFPPGLFEQLSQQLGDTPRSYVSDLMKRLQRVTEPMPPEGAMLLQNVEFVHNQLELFLPKARRGSAASRSRINAKFRFGQVMCDWNPPEGGPIVKKGTRVQIIDDAELDRWKTRYHDRELMIPSAYLFRVPQEHNIS